MKGSVNFKLGNTTYRLDVEERQPMETLHVMAVLGNPPTYCNECQNTENFTLQSNKDGEGNVYVNVQCGNPKCFAKAKLGQYKAGGYFWKKFEKYNRGGESQGSGSSGGPY